MNLGKLTGIKGLVSASQGRRRHKADLTPDMISPPLGDFRHTMHVGRGGDVFGDTSFLSNHGGEAETTPEKSSGFFSRTLRHVRRTSNRAEGAAPSEVSPPPPPISPIIKNAVSLPRLDVDTPNGCLQRVLFPSSPSCPETSTIGYGLESGFATLPRLSRCDRQSQDSPDRGSPELRHDPAPLSSTLPRSDSLISFTVDLGPSLLSEVFKLIENRSSSPEDTWKEDSEQHSAPLNDVLGFGSPAPMEKPLQENGEVPESAMRLSTRVESGMEAERFQRAADVLARHYGGVSSLKSQLEVQQHSSTDTTTKQQQKRVAYTYPDEEDEIKV